MTKQRVLTILKTVIYPIITLIIAVIIWYFAAEKIGKAIILPNPKSVISSLWLLLGERSFWTAIGGSMLRTVESYAISFSAALILAVAATFCKPFAKLFQPLVVISRAMPTMSIILLSLIWLKSKSAPILVAVLVIFPMLYTGFYDSFARVDGSLVEMSRVYKVKPLRIIGSLYVRECLPSIFSHVRTTLPFTLKLIIAAEVLSYTRESIGNLMYQANAYLDTAALLAWTIAAIVLGFLMELAVLCAEKAVVRWKA